MLDQSDKQILRFMRRYHEEVGYWPTLREIGAHLDFHRRRVLYRLERMRKSELVLNDRIGTRGGYRTWRVSPMVVIDRRTRFIGLAHHV